MTVPEATLSVVIVNWNGERFLRACLGSIFAQGRADVEVIVVDNGSTDGSVELIRGEFPEVRTIVNTENTGFAAANNQGIEAARGRYVLTLNNDTELAPRFFDTLMDAAESSDKEVGMWAVKILSLEDKSEIDSVGGLLIYPDGLAKGRGRLERDTGQYDAPGEALIPSACAGLYRKEMLDEVGKFDADFFAYCEDTDLGLRARLAGWRARSVPGAVVFHHYSGTGGRYTPFKAYLVERNHLWVAAKNLPAGQLAMLPVYTIWRYAVQVYGILAGKGAGGRFVEGFSAASLAVVLVKAYIGAMAGLPKMLARRARIQKTRKLTASEFKRLTKRFSISAAELVLMD